jgi:hypothetical protein
MKQKRPSALKDFIYGNLLYLLLAPLALALLLAEQEIAFGISRNSALNPSRGLSLGLTEQRLIAALALVFALRKIWLNTRR